MKPGRIALKVIEGDRCPMLDAGDLAGRDAFFEILGWPDGDFCFEQGEPDGELGPVKGSTTGLLMEGLRKIDEAGREGAEEQA